MPLTHSQRQNVLVYGAPAPTGEQYTTEMVKTPLGADVLRVTGFPVFRSGTFRDSMGDLMTWEPIHLQMMKQFYDLLHDNNILPNIPVRDGHPGFLINGMEGSGEVVGWHSASLNVETRTSAADGKEYDFLLATFDLTDDDGIADFKSGTYRSRSAEIMSYTTNDGAEYWPVYGGFAFVDFPAVEGLSTTSTNGIHKTKVSLHSVARGDGSKPTIMLEEGITQVDPQNTPPGNTFSVTVGDKTFSKPEDLANHAVALHGTTISQAARIAVLEQFQTEQREGSRKQFVASLGAGDKPKVLASKLPDLEAFALGLSDEQFATWSGTMSELPANPILGQHGGGANTSTTPGGTGEAVDAKTQRIADLASTVRNHVSTGMKGIKSFGSYQELLKLDPTNDILAKVKD